MGFRLRTPALPCWIGSLASCSSRGQPRGPPLMKARAMNFSNPFGKPIKLHRIICCRRGTRAYSKSGRSLRSAKLCDWSKNIGEAHAEATNKAHCLFACLCIPPSPPHPVPGGPASSVSAWRTFLIANEWNEIQTHRKVHPSLQLFAVLLVLEVSARPRRAH